MSEPMRALTVKQPWAGCIAHIGKNVENRTWPCPGDLLGTPIAIHAGKSLDDAVISVPDSDRWASLFASNAEWDAYRLWHLYGGKRDEENWAPRLALGAVVAVATVTSCHFDQDAACHGDPRTAGCLCSVWARPGQHHWRLASVRPLPEPVPCRGALGLWRLPEAAEARVREQLEAGRG